MNKVIKRSISVLLMALMISVMALECIRLTGHEGESHAASPSIESIEYDPEDREVSFEFYGDVIFKSTSKVRIYSYKKKRGKIVKVYYQRYILERDEDGLEVRVKTLKYGRKYYFKITGVKSAYGGRYRTLKGSFRALDYDD